LFVGRTHFAHRFACVVGDQDELARTLRQWVQTASAPRSHAAVIQEGELPRKAALAKFGEHCIRRCIETADAGEFVESLATVADLYVQGLPLDLHLLFPAQSRRIPLPTYPFARQRHWVEMQRRPQADAVRQVAQSTWKDTPLHPLLHRNTSDAEQVSFSSTFTGEETLLTDCKLQFTGEKERPVLPAGACVEMVRAAIAMERPSPTSSAGVELHHLRWGSPITAGHAAALVTSLFEDEAGRIKYEIFSVGAGPQGHLEEIHCRGEAVLKQQSPTMLDLQSLQTQMRDGALETQRMYEALEKLGMRYGPAHRCIQQIQLGEKQLLVRISVPVEPRNEYVVHPSLLEAVLQAAAFCLVRDGQLPAGPILPRAMALVSIDSACPGEAFAWVRTVPGSQGRPKIDVDLSDARGRVCARLRSIELSTPGRRTQAAGSDIPHQMTEDSCSYS
jgi:polyketide synthase PksN